MAEAVKEFFFNLIGNPYLAGIIISMLPIVELRGGIPYVYFVALKAGGFASLSKAFMCAFIGSSFMVPILLLFFMPIINWLKRTKLFKKLAIKTEEHFRKKSEKLNTSKSDINTDVKAENEENYAAVTCEDSDKIEKEKKSKKKKELFKYWGLFTFTAIPLPFTGVWTASAIAAILKMDFKKSLFFIILGNLVAGIAVSLICLFFGNIF